MALPGFEPGVRTYIYIILCIHCILYRSTHISSEQRKEMRAHLEQELTAKEEERKQKDALRRTLRAAENKLKGKKLEEVNACT